MNFRSLSVLAVAFSLSASAFAKSGWVEDFEKGLDCGGHGSDTGANGWSRLIKLQA